MDNYQYRLDHKKEILHQPPWDCAVMVRNTTNQSSTYNGDKILMENFEHSDESQD